MRKEKTLLFDVETTGLKPEKSFILTIGAVLWDSETNETKTFDQMANWKILYPNFSIPADTTKVHGITDEIMVKNGIHPYDLFNNFLEFLMDFTKGKLDTVVAFNLPYDQNMMRSNLQHMLLVKGLDSEKIDKMNDLLNIFTKGYFDEEEENSESTLFIDSLLIDRIINFEVDGVKVRHSLEAVGKRYGLGIDENAHNAMEDTLRLLEIYKEQRRELEEKEIEVNNSFEQRLIRKFKLEKKRFKKPDEMDYLASYIGAARL